MATEETFESRELTELTGKTIARADFDGEWAIITLTFTDGTVFKIEESQQAGWISFGFTDYRGG